MRKIIPILRLVPYYCNISYWTNNTKKIITTFLSIFGSVWLFIETANHFNYSIILPETTPIIYLLILFIVFLISLIINFPKLRYEVSIADTDIQIEIIVANILDVEGDKVIATNSTYDTTHTDNFISPNSIQGQFFKKYYNDVSHLDSDLSTSLESVEPIEILNRTKSKQKKYQIGTVAKLTHSTKNILGKKVTDFRSYWLALADVNEYGKPSSDIENLQVSLISLWDFIATKGHLENLVIPILGSGRTGINEKRERILQEIIFSFVAFASEKSAYGTKITEKLTIVIHPNDLIKHKIDFNELVGFIDYTCRYKSSKNFGKSKEL